MFKRNKKEFLRRFITVDETWIHYYTLETKEQSKQWISTNAYATNAYFEGLEKSYYSEGIEKLGKRWTKCIDFR